MWIPDRTGKLSSSKRNILGQFWISDSPILRHYGSSSTDFRGKFRDHKYQAALGRKFKTRTEQKCFPLGIGLLDSSGTLEVKIKWMFNSDIQNTLRIYPIITPMYCSFQQVDIKTQSSLNIREHDYSQSHNM